MQRKIRLMIGLLIMMGIIAGCWKVSKNLQKELKEEMETIGEAEKSDRIVVLDAGHGGTDSGKVGINGVKEKDINLTITNSVKKILEKENIQVIMTRETDEQLAQSKVEDLKYRVKIMNEASPVLAVSIHQNSYHEENVFGAQVFYYQTSTEGEKAAGIIQDALQKVNPDNTKKIKANNTYYILKKTEVPTVIVECGFLSNYKEAQKLVNRILYVDREDILSEEGAYFIADLIGLKVQDEDGKELGTVKDVIETGANDVYEVEMADGKSLLLPAIKQCILNVDVENGTMQVHVLEGLLDL